MFSKELNLIKMPAIRTLVENCLKAAPDYFWTMPASTTGKYHPEYTLGEGGLVRHTKAAVWIANELLRLDMFKRISQLSDEIYAALILHDTIKKGMDGSAYTTTDHPLRASEFVQKVANDTGWGDYAPVRTIRNLIETHMGQWNTDHDGNEVLPRPRTPEQVFVHLCDYLASRKFINITME
ncbi:MAG: HD domain-containing protein [Alphaproteobacteria bacterium]|nr:HD domain-containing protein [Alphaproteobacteria bacterium]